MGVLEVHGKITVSALPKLESSAVDQESPAQR